jgi:hypothetical protein
MGCGWDYQGKSTVPSLSSFTPNFISHDHKTAHAFHLLFSQEEGRRIPLSRVKEGESEHMEKQMTFWKHKQALWKGDVMVSGQCLVECGADILCLKRYLELLLWRVFMTTELFLGGSAWSCYEISRSGMPSPQYNS